MQCIYIPEFDFYSKSLHLSFLIGPSESSRQRECHTVTVEVKLGSYKSSLKHMIDSYSGRHYSGSCHQEKKKLWKVF